MESRFCGRFHNELGKPLFVCFLSFQLDLETDDKTEGRPQKCILIAPIWLTKTWLTTLMEHLIEQLLNLLYDLLPSVLCRVGHHVGWSVTSSLFLDKPSGGTLSESSVHSLASIRQLALLESAEEKLFFHKIMCWTQGSNAGPFLAKPTRYRPSYLARYIVPVDRKLLSPPRTIETLLVRNTLILVVRRLSGK